MKFHPRDGLQIPGVEDLDECMRFYDDWGLEKISFDEKSALYKTMDGSEVLLCHNSDLGLPTAIEKGPTIRHVVWGVENDATKDLSKNCKVVFSLHHLARTLRKNVVAPLPEYFFAVHERRNLHYKVVE